MGLPDRHLDIRNGLRSHASSPAIDGDSSGTDHSDRGSDVKMRVGSMYQAAIPEYNPDLKLGSDRAMVVWMPAEDKVEEDALIAYVAMANTKHGYNMEQALGMLYWHGYSLERATKDLGSFTPIPDEWSLQDKSLFEQAFAFHGKSFHRIKQMLPEKPIGSLVRYYYSWKKTRSKTSMMDKPKRDANAYSDSSDDSDSGTAQKCVSCNGRVERQGHKRCDRCQKQSGGLHGSLGGIERGPRRRTRAPKGFKLTKEDIDAMGGSPGQAEALVKQVEEDLVAAKRQVQTNKQKVTDAMEGLVTNIDSFRVVPESSKTSAVWADKEKLLAIEAVSRYGKDAEAIAEVLGNKTASHVRNFFRVFADQYGLESLYEGFLKQKYGDGQVPAEEASFFDDDAVGAGTTASDCGDEEEKMEVQQSEGKAGDKSDAT